MSDSKRPIPMPWKVRLRYLGVHWMQAPLFLGCLLALAWLWSGRISKVVLVGQVEALQVRVPAPEAGLLLSMEEPLSPYDRVDKDVTLIARIDVSEALYEMQTLSAERQRLQSLISSESERLRLEQRKWDQEDLRQKREVNQDDLARQRNQIDYRDQADDLQRELSQLRQRRRDLEFRQAESSSQRIIDQQEVQSLQRQREQVADLVQRKITPPLRLDELDAQIELTELKVGQSEQLAKLVQKQISEIDSEVADVLSRGNQTSQAWNEFLEQSANSTKTEAGGEETVVDTETLLEPLARALAVQDAKVQALAQRIASNEVHAPVSGVIAKVHQPPGTYVRSGDPIVTIASDQSLWIVAYVDQRYRGVLRPSDKVEIRMRGGTSAGVRYGLGTVVSLGAQYQAVPEHLRRHPDVVQWGLPVRISIPDGLAILPGEMVDLVFSFPESSGRSL